MNTPTVTLLSDLWFYDSVTNTLKYMLENNALNPREIDHRVQRNNLLQAGYILSSILKYYNKENTYHISLVGIHDCANNHLIYTNIDGIKLIAPNNGFITMLTLKYPNKIGDIVKVCTPYTRSNGQANVFSFIEKVIDIIKNDNAEYLNNIHDKTHNIKIIYRPTFQKLNNQEIICDIIQINYFNNLVINITKKEFEEIRQGRNFNYTYIDTDNINQIRNNYNNMLNETDKEFMIFNDGEYLEIGSFQGEFANIIGTHYKYSNCDFKTRTQQVKHLMKDFKIKIQFS